MRSRTSPEFCCRIFSPFTKVRKGSGNLPNGRRCGTGQNRQGQQRRERRLTIDIRQIQGIYTPKTAWQKGMADRHPLLCVYSVFVGLILRDGVQIRLYIFGFLGPLGLDSGRFTTPFLKCVSSNFSKKTNNPNPSPIKKIWFGLYWFGAPGRTRTCTPFGTRS